MAWIIAAATAALWCVLLAGLAAASEPRAVEPGAPTLDPPDDAPAALVALVTSDWELDRDAVTATVLDLAARRHVAVEWIAPHTFVRVRTHGDAATDAVTSYERQVLDHLRGLAAETRDGMIPAEALTTGPEAEARGWWTRFERAVMTDARARGWSRARWSPAARAALLAGALVVGLAVGAAGATLPHDDPDEDPVGTAVALAVVTTAGLGLTAGRLRGERDTPAGRAVAERWLGLREMLADDPIFPVQPPAAVAVWGRLMAYGAAMGLTGAAAAALPMGTERERVAWSPVGDRWRPVRIRYPSSLPPGYGRHPALVAAVGAVVACFGVIVGPAVLAAARGLVEGAADFAGEEVVPWWIRLVVGLVAGTFAAFAAFVALAGASMLVSGVADLVRGRRTIEGRVLRVRSRGDDDNEYWHVAVDDGTRDRVRAWRVDRAPDAGQGDTVRASVSRWLAHVTDLTVIDHGPVVVASSGPAAAISPTPSEPLPPLPDAAVVAAALGLPVTTPAGAVEHPLAVDHASATYVTDGGGRVVTAWVPGATIDALRALPRTVAPSVDGIGDEAYRAPTGGGILARFGDRVLLVSAALPASTSTDRDAAVASVAGLVRFD